MKGLLDFILFVICVEAAILDLREDPSTAVRPSAMADPTSGTKIYQILKRKKHNFLSIVDNIFF